jgi:phage terminase large subunit-like protein
MSQVSLSEVRDAAEADLATFIQLVDRNRVLGHVHKDVIKWWTRKDAKSHQLLLLPRDHMKSALAAFSVVWELTKDPTLRVLLISSTSNLAEKQLGFIKQILESQVHRRYWPDHINPDEGKREKWTNSEIALDHPLRREHLIRDPSIMVGGLTTGLTGFHADRIYLDDIVVYENAYTGEGRAKVARQISFLSSIAASDARFNVVGTRYDPRDAYHTMLEMTEDIYDEEGEITSQEPIYEVFQRQVEDRGDGSGQFLWPRQRRADGKWFGFDRQILAKKRGQYADRMQYRAQYYNDPTDPDSRPIDYDKFQYFEKGKLTLDAGIWYYNNNRLNLVAAVDFAFSTKKRADYTAIVVIGIDAENNIYVLDIDRFKTDRISDYYKHLMQLMNRWSFRKLRAECTSAQSAIVKELKEMYLKPNGIALKVEEYRPTRYDGSKEERLAAILEPRYDNLSIYHMRGGNWQVLEDELVSNRPPHDDVKDALASAIEIAVKPTVHLGRKDTAVGNVVYHPRFGGRAF